MSLGHIRDKGNSSAWVTRVSGSSTPHGAELPMTAAISLFYRSLNMSLDAEVLSITDASSSLSGYFCHAFFPIRLHLQRSRVSYLGGRQHHLDFAA
jgi:hypothetical protein